MTDMIYVDENAFADLVIENRRLRQQVEDLQSAGTAMVETRRNESITYNVTAFHRKYHHPISHVPSIPSDETVRFRLKLIGEEFFETAEACFSTPGLFDGAAYTFEKRLNETVNVDLVEFADGLCDLDYVVEGSRLVYGIPRVKVLEEVQRSNMQKLYNGQGKPIKPPDWTPPNIERVLLEAGWQR